MPPIPQRPGAPLAKQPRGFPCFFGTAQLQRVITGDIWAFLHHVSQAKLGANMARMASSYIDQAFDFYSAASTPRMASRPLLYYYAFLNLAKVFLLHRGVNLPPALMHGISDPRANRRQRLRLAGQVVRSDATDPNHSKVFPELAQQLTTGRPAWVAGEYRILDLLGQIPAIHRTYCAVTECDGKFCAIKSLEVIEDATDIWARVTLNTHDADTQRLARSLQRLASFRGLFHAVVPNKAGELCYESATTPVAGNLDTALAQLSEQVRACGVWTILTRAGYTHYFFPSAARAVLPQLASSYAVMFYLGSITRYKPYDFEKIVEGYSWLISEFLDTQPVQMTHVLASLLAETEVVTPYARSTSN